MAAPVPEVTTPMHEGRYGSGFLASGPNRPSLASLSRSCRKASWRAPMPFGCTDETMIWYWPRGS